MYVNNVKDFNKDEWYHCYSENLYSFLRFENDIVPVWFYIHNKTDKGCYVFTKSDRLQEALQRWTKRKGGDG